MQSSGGRRLFITALLVVATIGLIIALTSNNNGNTGYNGPHFVPVYTGGVHGNSGVDDGGGFDGDGGGGFHGGGGDG